MARVPNGSLGTYRKIAELLADRFRQGKLPSVKEGGVSDAAVFTVAFEGPFCDSWRGDDRELIDQLAKRGLCFVGVSGRRGGGAQDIGATTWKTGLDPAEKILTSEGEHKDLTRSMDNCGEAKVLIKLCSRILHDVSAYSLGRYVICSFEVYSPSKLHLKDPCKNCKTWVFKVFGEVICHQSARPGGGG
jgi:hypothetical protein